MIKHAWEPAEGTIVGCQYKQLDVPGRHARQQASAYEIDVRTPEGKIDRAQVPSAGYTDLRPGTIVRLEINSSTGEIRMHPRKARLVVGFSVTASGIQDDDVEARTRLMRQWNQI